MGVGTSIVNSILGTTAKAGLLIYRPADSFYTALNEYRALEKKKVDDELEKTAVAAQKATLAASIDMLITARMATAGLGVTALYKAVMSGDSVASTIAKKALFNGYKYYEFQYNPETIDLSGQQGSFMARQGAPSSGLNELSMTNIDAETKLAFKVIFDQVNSHDAFMADKLRLTSGTDILNTITMFCNTYSVQGDVDGLLAITTQPVTRRVIFCFGRMFFSGEVEAVTARYTMFSPSGRPVAAEVDFSIRQSRNCQVKTTQAELNQYDNGYWDRAVEDFFGKAGEDSKIDLRPFGLGNLLNLNG